MLRAITTASRALEGCKACPVLSEKPRKSSYSSQTCLETGNNDVCTLPIHPRLEVDTAHGSDRQSAFCRLCPEVICITSLRTYWTDRPHTLKKMQSLPLSIPPLSMILSLDMKISFTFKQSSTSVVVQSNRRKAS